MNRHCLAVRWFLGACLAAPLVGLGAGLFVNTGDILTANYLANKVVKVNPQTGEQESLGDFTGPMDLVLTAGGELYVGELTGSIKRLTLADGSITVINPSSALTSVRGLTLGPAGELFVTGRTNTVDVVMRVDPASGSETIVTQGDLLSLPTGIEFLDATTLVVASFLNSRIVKVSLADGSQTVLASGGGWIDQPWGLAVSGDSVYAGHYDSKHLNRISASTGEVSQFGSAPGFPFGLGVDAQGNLLVGAVASTPGQADMLLRLSPQGANLANFNVGLRQQISGIEVASGQFGVPPTNTPPVLDPIGDKAVDEGTELAFRVTATDADLPAQTLTFSLEPGAPTGAGITTDGAFSWRPSEIDGPGTYAVVIRVTDSGALPLSDTNGFTVTVHEVNAAPDLSPINEQAVAVGSLLTFDLLASDADLPAQVLTYHLIRGGELGATLSPEGRFRWSPAAGQAPSTNHFTVSVRDDGIPAGSVTNNFVVVAHDLNTPPTWAPVPPQTVNEDSLLDLQLSAIDTNRPAQTLSFRLGPQPPPGVSLSTDGVFSWTPSEGQGPDTYAIAVIVTDDGLPPLAATNRLTVTVREVNSPPTLAPIPEQSIMASNRLAVVLTATDSDLPAQSMTFGLAGTAPPGVSVSPEGVFEWTPTYNQAPHTYAIPVKVHDDGTPSLASTQTISVVVRPQFVIEVGDILAVESTSGSILKIRPDSGAQQVLAFSDSPTDLALGSNGMLYVSETGGLIKQLNLTNGLLAVVNPADPLPDAQALAVGSDGALFVASISTDRVYRVDPAAGTVSWLTEGDLLAGPSGIEMLNSTHLVVSSLVNNRVVAVALTDGTQSLIAEENGLNLPWGITVSGAEVQVASYGAGAIHRISDGTVRLAYTVEQGAPAGLATGGDGELIVSTIDEATNQLLRLSSTGTLLQTYSGGAIGVVTGVEVAQVRVGPVLPTNSPPVVWDDAIDRLSTNGCKVLIATLLANDLDVDGDSLQFVGVSGISLGGGSVVQNGEWIVYSPPAGFTAADSFAYTVADGQNPPVSGTVFVLVNPDLVPAPNLSLTERAPGSFLLQFDGIPGKTYRVQYAETLSEPVWQTLGSNTADSFGEFLFTNAPPPGVPERFYRSIYP